MNSSIYRFTLDMHKVQSQISIPVLLGDTSRSLFISLTDGVVPYVIADGCLAMLTIKRPTGTFLQEFCAIVNNEYIRYDFSQNENTAAEAGFHECEVTLYGVDGLQVSSPRFSMIVSSRVINSDDINISDEDKTAVDNMLATEAAREAAETARVAAESERVTAEEARNTAETARVLAETARVAAEAARVAAEKLREDSFKIVFIRYSASADGTDFTETWSSGQRYIGVATAKEAPQDKSGYEWSLFVGEDGEAGLPSVTEENDGMIAQVVDGKWTAVAILDAEEDDY